MKVRVILNPKAGSAEQRQWMDALRDGSDVEFAETAQRGDAARLAQEAPAKGFDTVVAAGGDGTIHEVITGLVQRTREQVRLGIIPLGTGNDFVRTLGIPTDPLEAVAMIQAARERPIDVMKMTSNGEIHYGGNVAAGGFTGQMNEAMTDDLKQTWGPLAYLRGALKVLPDLTTYETFIRFDDSEATVVDAYNIIVANGRTAGGGTVVAPQANPEDGLLDVVIVRRGTLADLTGVAARLIAGDYTTSDIVSHRRARKIVIWSKPGMWFNLDGELVTNEPVEFEMMPGALRVIVGEAYRAEAPEQAGA